MKRIGWSKVVATRISVRIAVLVLITVAFRSTATAQNPVPLMNQRAVHGAGSPSALGFTLTVNGTGFLAGSIVQWNGAARVTHVIDQGRLATAIPATDIANAGTASITVVNPG